MPLLRVKQFMLCVLKTVYALWVVNDMNLALLNYLFFLNKHHLFGLGKSPTGKGKKK